MVYWNFDGDVDKILLTDEDVADLFKICVLQGFVDAAPEFSGGIGPRIVSIFVVLITATVTTLLPVLCQDFNFKIPLYAYLFARYFGAGVIIATAFVHLMDPAYGAIGSNTCVGGWGNWAVYSWPPAFMLLSIFSIFLIELCSEIYVERRFGTVSSEPNVEDLITDKRPPENDIERHAIHMHVGNNNHQNNSCSEISKTSKSNVQYDIQSIDLPLDDEAVEFEFNRQIYSFMVLEFGVIFHSVIIGLNLGSTEYDEFKTLFIVIIFHQSFEGLGIGARLSAIPWPASKSRGLCYALCCLYGLVTPIAIAIGIGIRNTYASSSFIATVVSGILDSLSAGILIYSGLVELLARDFVFNDAAKKDLPKLCFNVGCTLLGCMVMALLGKWA